MRRRSSSSGSRSAFRSALVRAVWVTGSIASLAPMALAASTTLGARAVPAQRAEAAQIPSPPSLILPGAVDPSEGLRSGLPLAEVIRLLVADAPASAPGSAPGSAPLSAPGEAPPPEPAQPDAATLDRATRRYVEGRAAMLEGKMLVAVRALEDALSADPSSVTIMAALARAYARAGNQPKAVQLYEDVVKRSPDDAEALLTLGLRGADRLSDEGSAESTVRFLGQLFQLDAPRRAAFFGGLRPATESIVEIALGRGLRQLNADAAAIEVLSRTVKRDDSDLNDRARSEARRALGDAYARRGDLAAAATTWMNGAVSSDVPSAAIIEPRIAWALVATQREGEAIGRLRGRVAASGPSEIDVALASWLRSAVRDAGPLTRWGAELAGGKTTGEAARLAWTLAPDSAHEIRIDPSDRRALRDEFARRWRAGELDRAVGLAIEVLNQDPLGADRVVTGLLRSGASAPELLQAVAATGGGGAVLQARLWAAVSDPGQAWRIANDARNAKPSDRGALRAAIDAAGDLAEPGYLEDLARDPQADDASTLIELARAWRLCDDAPRAEETARRAAERAAGATPPDRRTESAALVVLAQAQADAAARSADRRRAADAVASARSAVTSDPKNESAWRLLLGFLDALAAGEGDDRPARRSEANQARADAMAALPSSALARHIVIERWFSEGAVLEGIHAAVALSAADPGDPELLRLAITGLTRVGREEAATAVIDERLADTPGDPLAWQLWTEATIASGRPEQALDRIVARAEPPTSDPIAIPLKELALRAAGRSADADIAAAERVARLPASPRRDLEKAAQALGRGEADAAARALDSAAKAATSLPVRESLAAAELAFRLPDARDRARLVRTFAKLVLAASSGGQPPEPAVIARAAALSALEADPAGDSDAEMRRMTEIAVGAARGGVGAGEVPAWLAIGQSFADRGRPSDGAGFLAALLRSEARIDSQAAARLASACFALDAVSGGGAERSIALLDLLRSRGVRPFARADRSEATDAEALQLLSGLYSVLGDRRGSMAILREALHRDPEHAMSANNLAWDAIERGHIDDEAIRLAELAFRVRPDDPAILDTVGWLRYLQGQLVDRSDVTPTEPGAVTLLSRAVDKAGGSPGPDPLDHLGDALWRTGDHDGAVRSWRAAESTIQTKFPKEQMLRTLATYERREHGVSVADGEAFWKRNYGEVLDRVKQKIAQAARGEEPSVAPLAAVP